MRDLFQVVFELKKKEIEMAKQQLGGKGTTSGLLRNITVSGETKSKVRFTFLECRNRTERGTACTASTVDSTSFELNYALAVSEV